MSVRNCRLVPCEPVLTATDQSTEKASVVRICDARTRAFLSMSPSDETPRSTRSRIGSGISSSSVNDALNGSDRGRMQDTDRSPTRGSSTSLTALRGSYSEVRSQKACRSIMRSDVQHRVSLWPTCLYTPSLVTRVWGGSVGNSPDGMRSGRFLTDPNRLNVLRCGPAMVGSSTVGDS